MAPKRLELHQQCSISTGIEDAWRAVTHPVDGDKFSGSLKIKIGASNLVYNGSGRFVSRDDVAKRAVFEAHGQETRGKGEGAVTVIAHLRSDQVADQGPVTVIELSTTVTLTGQPAQFDQAVIVAAGDRLLQQFLARVAARTGATAELTRTTSRLAPPEQGSPRPPLALRRYGLPVLSALLVVFAGLSLLKRRRRISSAKTGRRRPGA